MIPDGIIEQFRQDRDRYYAQAQRAIENLQADLAYAVQGLAADPPYVTATIGGSVLNHQYWQDAERALVRFWDAAGVVANLETSAGESPDAAAWRGIAKDHAAAAKREESC